MKRPSSFVRRGWTREYQARAIMGNPVDPLFRGATSFSLAGAMFAAKVPETFWDEVRTRIGQEIATSRWNDAPGRTQAEVVALLEEIEALPEFAGLWEEGNWFSVTSW